jgi:hypothetical protein
MMDDGAMDDGAGITMVSIADEQFNVGCVVRSLQFNAGCAVRSLQFNAGCVVRSLQLAARSCSLQHAQLYSCTHARVLYVVLYIHIIQTFYTHSSI